MVKLKKKIISEKTTCTFFKLSHLGRKKLWNYPSCQANSAEKIFIHLLGNYFKYPTYILKLLYKFFPKNNVFQFLKYNIKPIQILLILFYFYVW